MYNLFFFFVIIIFSAYTFIKTLAYAKYEKDSQNNKSGAIALIAFSAFSIILSCILVMC